MASTAGTCVNTYNDLAPPCSTGARLQWRRRQVTLLEEKVANQRQVQHLAARGQSALDLVSAGCGGWESHRHAIAAAPLRQITEVVIELKLSFVEALRVGILELLPLRRKLIFELSALREFHVLREVLVERLTR